LRQLGVPHPRLPRSEQYDAHRQRRSDANPERAFVHALLPALAASAVARSSASDAWRQSSLYRTLVRVSAVRTSGRSTTISSTTRPGRGDITSTRVDRYMDSNTL